MQEYEKLGAFYLGKTYDTAAGRTTDELLLYDAKDLTTHAVCVGMTGSGKTGLGIALLEEAAIDGIPAIVIDPKGDLGNLLLAFPNLQPSDFAPWIDPAEAARKELDPETYAARIAETWRAGLADWGQDANRIGRYLESAELCVYTPGSTSGTPLALLRSFEAPPPELVADETALRDRIMSAVSGLLGLVGIQADPIQSREHILLSNILDRAWREGRSIDIGGLIHEIQKPPFDMVGVFDVESFYPSKDRLALAMSLNNLLASPGFAVWMQGDPLDVQRLLYTREGKPRISVIYIAHLSDAERMFFVTLLLNEVLAWMRAQSGTSSLRALLYMDEIYGYFPPTAMPPSKTPMLTLLKQARAFGLGVVLATQNPVDLDYKGLSNTGTWFIGRLQTERDKARVIEGLESVAAAGGGSLDRAALDAMISGLGSRVFLMRNVHDDAPVLFQTRWVMSYLRGPLTLPQIKALMTGRAQLRAEEPTPAAVAQPAVATPAQGPTTGAKPLAPPDVQEHFLRPHSATGEWIYRPAVLGQCRLHYVDSKSGVDVWETRSLIAPVSDDGHEVRWSEAQRLPDAAPLDRQTPQARFAELPAGFSRARNYQDWRKMLESHLYQHVTLSLDSCPSLKLTAKPDEGEGDFRARITHALHEKRDAEVERLKKKYAPKLATLQDRERRAQERVQREQAQVGQHQFQTALSVGSTVLGALFGRKVASVGNVGRATSAMRGAGRISREKQDVARAQETLESVQQQIADLQAEFNQEVASLQSKFDPASATVTTVEIRPRKSDIDVSTIGLVWLPYRMVAEGVVEPDFQVSEA